MAKVKILFVCLGNICRSPLAEEVFRTYLSKQGKANEYLIDSAGLISYHKGELPDKRMREHARRKGYVLTHRSRPVDVEDFYNFDYIIGMDNANIQKLEELAPGPEEMGKIYRMADFCPDAGVDHVPDPYYGGSEGFENVIYLIESACSNLLEKIEQTK